MEELRCPFCGYMAENEYTIMYHLEDLHSEGDSKFIVKDGLSERDSMIHCGESHRILDDDLDFVACPREGCGETILLTELDSHIEMHGAEEDDDEVKVGSQPAKRHKKSASSSSSKFDTNIAPALRNLVDYSSTSISSPDSLGSTEVGTNTNAKARWRKILDMPSQRLSSGEEPTARKSHRRLGKAELGPYAHEKQMPQWLKSLLERDGQFKEDNESTCGGKASKSKCRQNHVLGVVPVIERLLQQDPSTEYAYVCHYSVQHISKVPNEGGFCGYRNIQMMTSYIIGAQSQGFPHFHELIPSIFQIQDFIESAWDLGIHAQGRLETGGIRGTRKYIGTPEAQAMFISLDISCVAQGLKGQGLNGNGYTTRRDKGRENKADLSAEQLLFQYVEQYFSADCMTPELKVRSTGLPPLYFQHPGHSLTIIGFEKGKDGSRNILVFDPMFHDATDIRRLIGQDDFTYRKPGELLRAYRRTSKYLRKYKEFEVLRLNPPKLDSNV